MTVTTLLIIDKSGTPKVLTVKDFKMEDLYKKCFGSYSISIRVKKKKNY